MIKDEIKKGVEQLVELHKTDNNSSHDILSNQWRTTKNKIDAILLSTNVLKNDDMLRSCNELDNMSHEDRQTFISKTFGSTYTIRISPLLEQLNTLELELRKTQ